MKAPFWCRSEVPCLAPVYDKDDFINRNDSKDQIIPFLHFADGLILKSWFITGLSAFTVFFC